MLPPAMGGEDLSTYKGRLRHLLRERHMTPNAVEAAAARLIPPPGPGEKLSRGEVNRLTNPTSTRGARPSVGKTRTLCRILGAHQQWLLLGIGPMEGSERPAESDRLGEVQRRLELLERHLRPTSDVPPPMPSRPPPHVKLAHADGRKRAKR
jgi:hypothetical protein